MIFRRAIISELSSNAGAVFTVLFTIVFSVSLVRILGEAAGGKVDNQAVFALMALSALTSLPLLLSLTLFIAILITLSRAYRDSEMVVWFASGQSLTAWLAPVLRFALPGVLAVALLSMLVTPWANGQISESRQRYAQRDDVSRVAPGRFIESGSVDRVFFVENVDLEGSTVRNVFVSTRQQGREGVIVAASGAIETGGDGERYLVLSQGRRYEGVPGQAEYRMVEFERYAIRIEARPDAPLQERRARNKTLQELLATPSPWHQAELLWRIGMPLLALLLSLLAIPLAYTNPRLGRSANLIVAVLVYLLYLTAMQVLQGYVQLQRLSFAVAVWAPHAVVLALLVLLYLRRVYVLGWLPRRLVRALRRLRPDAGAARAGEAR
jgi:lipopolysaccharide export system permease protein